MYQLKGFSRFVIGFDVHKNHIESPYSRSVFNFLPGLDSYVGLCAVTCLATLNISILQSISGSNWNVLDFGFLMGVYTWRAFRGRKTSRNVQCLLLPFNRGSL